MRATRRCSTCPLGRFRPNPEIATWAWFDMLADNADGYLPVPSDNSEVISLLDNAAAQAGIKFAPGERPENQLAVQALMMCFHQRATGGCPMGGV